jgi:hypothetical protein
MYWFTPHGALEMDITELADIVCQDFAYLPTDAEMAALQWIGHRYEVTAYLLGCVVDDEDEDGEVTGQHMEIEPAAVAVALAEDGLDRVPCLDEGTALARIVWAIGPDEFMRAMNEGDE